MLNLDDPRTARIGEVIGNKTSKRILSLLADKEMSESEIALELKLPLNTVGYNIKKLEESELIEKKKGFLWSSKGKRIHKYRVSNKIIVISPRKIFSGIIPSVLISGIIALLIKAYMGVQIGVWNGDETVMFADNSALKTGESVANAGGSGVQEMANQGIYYVLNNAQNSWAWFFLGALTGLLVYIVWNWRKK